MLWLPFTAVIVVVLRTVAPLLAVRVLTPCDLHEAQYVLLKVTLTCELLNVLRELSGIMLISVAAAIYLQLSHITLLPLLWCYCRQSSLLRLRACMTSQWTEPFLFVHA